MTHEKEQAILNFMCEFEVASAMIKDDETME